MEKEIKELKAALKGLIKENLKGSALFIELVKRLIDIYEINEQDYAVRYWENILVNN